MQETAEVYSTGSGLRSYCFHFDEAQDAPRNIYFLMTLLLLYFFSVISGHHILASPSGFVVLFANDLGFS